MPEQPRPATWQDLIRVEAKAHGVPEALALSIAEQESGFNPSARSPKGAIGLMQLMPDTAKELGVNADDPFDNIRGGLRYFKQQLDASGGDVTKALSAYYAGPAGGDQPEYVQGVLGRMGRWQGTSLAPGQPSFANVESGSSSVSTPPPAPRTKAEYVQQAMKEMGMDANAPPQPSFLSAFDPREAVGRRNWAGTAGSMIGGAAGLAFTRSPQGAVGGSRLGGTIGGIVGSMVGGGAEEAVEQAVGGPPVPGSPSAVSRIGGAAVEQGINEVLGRTVGWIAQAPGRRLVAGPVAERAIKAVEEAHTAIESRVKMQRPAVTPSAAGELAEAVIRGPAKSVKGQMGEAIATAAESGPPVSTAPLRARLTELGMEITPLAGTDAGTVTVGGREWTVEQAKALLKRNPELALAQIPETLQLPAVLALANETVTSGETIPFAEAHKIKRLLDDTINFDATTKKIKAQVTEAFRNTLRGEMRGHAPYDAATAAYAPVAKMYSKGLIPALHKTIFEHPGRLIKQITWKNPRSLQLLKDVTVDMAAEGGAASEGEGAWNAIRAAWTHEKLVAGGLDKLVKEVERMEASGDGVEFIRTMYGDADGQLVWNNLKQIKAAYESVVDREVRLKASSLLTRTHDPVTVGGDIARVALAPLSSYGITSGMRLWIHGPKISDLLEWSIYSPKATQAFVQAMTSPTPGIAFAALARSTGLFNQDLINPMPSHESTQPPPAPSSTVRTSTVQPPPQPRSLTAQPVLP